MTDQHSDSSVGIDDDARPAARRPWSPPRVILATMQETRAKVLSAATPDSHFGSNDYGLLS